ncbi:uncharacterized protein LOC123334528 [Bubalus bubalis]|uniref:uncharacterized protein LOC123334528 n=1 Tax=Bubalus bubalis TaxID=89462 RepID=UPI001D0FFF5F|nr:uncharacterized protein LOC123334528 [Bubalus bubalis]
MTGLCAVNLSRGTGFQEAPEVEEEALQLSNPRLLPPQVPGVFLWCLHLPLQVGQPVPEQPQLSQQVLCAWGLGLSWDMATGALLSVSHSIQQLFQPLLSEGRASLSPSGENSPEDQDTPALEEPAEPGLRPAVSRPRPISTSALRPTRGTTPCMAPSTSHETLAFLSLSPRNAATTKACRDSPLPGPRGGRPRPAGARGLGLVPTG